MHPLEALFEWFPSSDFGVMDHGFLPHGRDYIFIVETNLGNDPGQHKLQFTHVVDLCYATTVNDDLLAKSWGEEFVVFQGWVDAGEPEGYIWGTEWSMAWPGLKAIEPSVKCNDWSKRLNKSMYEAQIETERFRLNFVFHSLRHAKVSDDTSTVSRCVIPLASAS